jgi:hypothetical protein
VHVGCVSKWYERKYEHYLGCENFERLQIAAKMLNNSAHHSPYTPIRKDQIDTQNIALFAMDVHFALFLSKNFRTGEKKQQQQHIEKMAAAMDIDEEAQAGVSGDRAGKKRFEVKKVIKIISPTYFPLIHIFNSLKNVYVFLFSAYRYIKNFFAMFFYKKNMTNILKDIASL